MKAFFFVFFVTLIFAWWLPANSDEQYLKKLIVTFLPLFVFGAIRVDFGLDYPAYEAGYDNLHGWGSFELSENTHFEIGYQFLCYIIPSFRLLLIINSLLLCLAFVTFCYENIPNKYLWLAVLILFLNPEKNIYGSLVGIRNGLVVSGFLIGFVLVQKRKLLPFIALTLALSTIHKSALLFLPISYFISRTGTMTKKEAVFWLICTIGLMVLGTTFLVDVIGAFLDFTDLERYEGYLNSGVKSGILLGLSNVFFIGVFLWCSRQKTLSFSEKENTMIRMGLWYLCSSFLGSLAARCTYFYDMFFIAAIVAIAANKDINKTLRWGISLFAIIVSCYSTFVVWMGKSYFPHWDYYSIWGSWLW